MLSAKVKYDLFTWVGLISMLILFAAYLIPHFPDSLHGFLTDYAQFFLIALVCFALLQRSRSTVHREEKRFWYLLTSAFSLWLVADGIRNFKADFNENVPLLLAFDGIYLLSYLSFLISVEQKPHRESEWSRDHLGYRFASIGTVIFIVCLIFYFILLPSKFEPELYITYVPTMGLFVLLDFILTVRFIYLGATCESTTWNWIYGLLGASFGLWFFMDALDCSRFIKGLSVEVGSPLDLPYFVPFALFILASRLSGSEVNPDQIGRFPLNRSSESGRAVGASSQLLVYAFLFPVIHFMLYGLNIPDTPDHGVRAIIVLTALLVLLTLTIIQQTQLEKRNRSLESRIFELATNEQLLQTQKLEALGRLAGGVAHDFNNLLLVIRGYSDLLLERLDRDDILRSYVDRISSTTDHAVEMTSQLLAFGRKQPLQPKVFDFNTELNKAQSMLRRLIGENIEMVTLPSPQPAYVLADPAQIVQVIINLAINARDSMPDGGRLTLQVSFQDFDDHSPSGTQLPPGRYVTFTATDNGCGMDLETQAKMFEPFFTTRQSGAGLGLAVVYGIIKQSHGHITVDSRKNEGTCIHIFLPYREDVVPEDSSRPAEPISLPRGRETILLAEDDDQVREMVSTYLSERGYQVLAARNGQAALDISKRHEGRIALLLTDVLMPGMNGVELGRLIRRERPETKLIFMSGYSDNITIDDEPGSQAVFLQKPFSPNRLELLIREVSRVPQAKVDPVDPD